MPTHGRPTASSWNRPKPTSHHSQAGRLPDLCLALGTCGSGA